MRTRPLGFTLAALFLLLEAIFALGVAAFMLWNPGSSSNLSDLFERFQLSTAFSSLLALGPLLTAGLAGLLFRSLWAGREWARVAALVFMLLMLLLAAVLIAFMAAFDLASPGNVAVAGLLGVVAAVIFFLLLRSAPTPAPAAVPLPAADVPPSFVERAPALTPPPAVAAPSAPPVVRPVPSVPALVPPPPRPGRAAGSGVVDDVTLASRPADAPPPTQQLPAPTAAPRAWLTVRQGDQLGMQFEVVGDRPFTIGRDANRVDGVLADPSISGRHAQIRYEISRFVLYDLGSTNGTYVSERLVQSHPLADGDEIRLGMTMLRFSTVRL